MRYLYLFLLTATLAACDPGATTPEETTPAAPDREADGEEPMMLTAAGVESETVFDFEDIIWGFTWLPDGRILATVKDGRFLLIDGDGHTEIAGAPEVRDAGQGGLLDVLLDQDFENNRYVYLTYSRPEQGGELGFTSVGRGTLSQDATRLENFTSLYDGGPATDKGQHYGSRMVWGPENGHLYFTIGDRGNRDENPQDTTRDGGKVYRITADGAIPQDNPFAGVPGAKEAIYSYGHRNLQGLAVHPETGAIWEHEHGPRGGDEVNVIEAGKNYGWPVITYGINYDGTQITQEVGMEGMEQPVHYWVPSIAPSGMAFVTGDRYPGWKNDLLVGSLRFSFLKLVHLDGTEVTGEQDLIKNIGRLRDVRMGPDDYIYASIEGTGIVRVVPRSDELSR
ncbi:glucose/arabinose dehydrogenase [Neolewinella xylanilytica]|uniref:Glucose/arabinose dehydrogenase n=1 Tax=Neolewinella xylanilytica TaxID=1514080 RepID=A0A2S6IAI6_9BACT|nr:PQQ-dependent sugar dehydrogenase [Neolewinella xylanilytica]PPK88514.1 glucose/arabinose dehydrogenase [Neolewinella xylanilytica]